MDNNNIQVQQAVNAALDEQKKKKRKKRLIILGVIAAIIVIIIAISAIGGSGDSANNDNTGNSVSAQNAQEAEGTIGDYVCTVKSAEVCKNWEGKDSVKITYSFTNNGEEAESFDLALTDNVYQDGVELDTTFIDSSDDEEDWGIDAKIKPGVTKEVIKVYKLRNKESDLEIEIGEWLSFDDTKVKTTVSIK